MYIICAKQTYSTIHTVESRHFITIGTRGTAEDVSEAAHKKPMAPRVAFHTSFLVFPLNCKGRKSK